MGYELGRAGLAFVIVDGAAEVGQSWRRRWDSLRLFTPARYSALPGLPFPAAADHLPGKDEVAAYLADYARHFALPLRLGAGVRELRRAGDGGFDAVTDHGTHTARSVVVATGPFQQPAVPAFAEHLPPEITQIHTAHYRNPDQLPDGPVLVVGAGTPGSRSPRNSPAPGRSPWPSEPANPRSPNALSAATCSPGSTGWASCGVPAQSRLGRRMRERDPLIGTSLRDLERQGVRLIGRVGEGLRTVDGQLVDAATIVWATGYRPDYSWLTIPEALGVDGEPRHEAGVSPVPGLYYLGLPYQRTRGSARLGWVGHDATHFIDHLARRPSTVRS